MRRPKTTMEGLVMQSVNDRLTVKTGEQTLVSVDTMSSVVGDLPEEAYENLLVISSSPPSRIERAIRDAGGDPNKCGHVPVTGSPVTYEGPLWTTEPVAPSDLTGISIRYSTAMKHVSSGSGWFCLDGLQLLLMYADRDRVSSFVSELARRTRGRDVTGVYGIASDTVDDETYDLLRPAFDASVDHRQG